MFQGLGRFLNAPVVVPVLNESGKQINTLKRSISYFVENKIELEMMKISGGKFLMGTSAAEVEAAYEDAKSKKAAVETRPETIAAEMPQHQVNVAGFFMSRTEITQDQWQAVMGGDKLSDIDTDFRGADLPID